MFQFEVIINWGRTKMVYITTNLCIILKVFFGMLSY
jgi:hypothetical protein